MNFDSWQFCFICSLNDLKIGLDCRKIFGFIQRIVDFIASFDCACYWINTQSMDCLNCFFVFTRELTRCWVFLIRRLDSIALYLTFGIKLKEGLDWIIEGNIGFLESMYNNLYLTLMHFNQNPLDFLCDEVREGCSIRDSSDYHCRWFRELRQQF